MATWEFQKRKMSKSKNGLKPWPDLWQEILDYRYLDITDCDLDPDEQGWVSIHCPLHNDENPSFRVNVESGGIKCLAGCDAGKNLNDLESLILDSKPSDSKNNKPDDPVADLADNRLLPVEWLQNEFGVIKANGGYIIPSSDPLSDINIDLDTETTMDDEEADIITKQREDHKIWKRGRWVSEDSTRPKYAWRPKFGKNPEFSAKDLIYNMWRVKGKEVFITAGAPDTWVMHYVGFPAVSFLGGEGTPPSARAIHRMYAHGVREATIIYDNDKTGRDGARNVAVELSKRGIQAFILALPDELGEKADVTDLWKHVKGDQDEFVRILDSCEQRSFTADVVEEADAETPPEGIERLSEDCWVEPFGTYRSIMTDCTESPDEFHFFSLMTVIGALIGRKAFVKFGRPTYPNIFLCLIGATGSTKKSTTMNHAITVKNMIDKDLQTTDGSGSAEGIMEQLAFCDADPSEHEAIKGAMGWKLKQKSDDGVDLDADWLYEKPQRRLLIHQDEFTGLLSKAKGRSGSGTNMIPNLLTVHDSPTEIRLPVRTKPLLIPHPVVSMLSGSTAEFLTKWFDDQEWYSGFGNRMTFVRGDAQGSIPFPPSPDEEKLDKMAGRIKRAIQNLKWVGYGEMQKGTEFELDDEAKTLWESFYNEWHAGRDEDNPDHMAATQRTPEKAAKFALILAVLASVDFDDYIINAEDVNVAWKLSLYAEESTKTLVDQLVQEDKAASEQIIIRWMKGQGAATKEKIRHRFHRYGSETFNRMFMAMEEVGMIEKNEAGKYIVAKV